MENERPMKLYQADLIEIADEHLTYMHEAWILTHGKDLPEDAKNFIAWCRAEHQEQMHCKRGGDKKSFFERREESKKAIREHS
jgi:hypothetical protein